MSFKSLLIILLGCSLLTRTAADDQPRYQLSFSSTQSGGIPVLSDQTEFNCSDLIYSIIVSQNIGTEPIEATLIWRNPSGQIQEKTPVSLYPGDNEAFGWAWLKLNKTTGAALLSFFDDSIGMNHFIGKWQVELFVVNNNVANNSFKVLC